MAIRGPRVETAVGLVAPGRAKFRQLMLLWQNDKSEPGVIGRVPRHLLGGRQDRQRRHSAPGMLTPVQYEIVQASEQPVALDQQEGVTPVAPESQPCTKAATTS